MSVCCECCVMSGKGLCDELITRQEESYRLWWVGVCGQKTLGMRGPWPKGGGGGPLRQKQKKKIRTEPLGSTKCGQFLD